MNTLIATAAALLASSDTSALQAEARFGALAPTKDEVKELWPEATPETGKKRKNRANHAVARWAEAAKYSPELAELATAYAGGLLTETEFDNKLAFIAAMTGVVLDSALTLSCWLEAIAEKGTATAAGKGSESVAKLTGQNKAAKRAPRQPKAQTASAKGAKSSPEIAATEAGAHRPATTVDSASSEDAAAADAATSAMLAAIAQAMELASAAPDAATAAAIMAAQWAKAVGVTLPQ